METERIKLRATYWNNLAIGVILGGVFIPWLTMMAKNVRPLSLEGQLAFATIAVALCVGYLLRYRADRVIQRIKD